MRLDRTRITIAERSLPEILDLAMLVLRTYPWQIGVRILPLAVPFAIFNYWLISWMTLDLLEMEAVFRYLFNMLILVYVEGPIASSLAVLYLGKLTFFEQPSWRDLWSDLWKALLPMIYTQGIRRGTILVLIMYALIEVDEPFSVYEVLLIPICLLIFLVRSCRPYLVEILLLEQPPFRRRSPNQPTIRTRNQGLHDPDTYDLFARGISFVPVVLLLSCSVLGGCWFLHDIVTNEYSLTPALVHIVIPAVMWSMVCFATVVRFFSYLDLRIRREGWEVQLLFRAESFQLLRRLRLLPLILVFVAYSFGAGLPVLGESVDEIKAGQRALQEVDPPWYDGVKDDLDESIYEKLAEAATTPPPQRGTWERMRRNWEFNSGSTSWIAWDAIIKGIAWTVLIVLVGLLIYALVYTYLGVSPVASLTSADHDLGDSIEEQQRIENLPVQLRTTQGDFLSMARQLYQQGNYREAIIYLFSYRLLQLDRAGMIHLTKGKTNRQYLLEIRNRQELHPLLAQTMAAFEDVFFGHYDLGRERFESCWTQNDRFQQLLIPPPN